MNKVTSQDIAGITVTIEYKTVKHLHLSVHPPDGEVRAVIPTGTKPEKVRLFIVSRLGWIRRKQRDIAQQPRQQPNQYTEGETLYLWGKQYRLRLRTTSGKHRITRSGDWLELHLRKGADRAGRQRAVSRFYREELTKEIFQVSRKWERKLGFRADEYRIKLMYTKWGSCNAEAKRIWLNLELAKHPKACLSYLVLHELLHFKERGHTPAFQSLITQHLPGWRAVRETLNNGLPGLPELKS